MPTPLFPSEYSAVNTSAAPSPWFGSTDDKVGTRFEHLLGAVPREPSPDISPIAGKRPAFMA
jgi:hypothetical protein